MTTGTGTGDPITFPDYDYAFDRYRKAVARYLGYSQDADSWGTTLTAVIDDIIRQGVHQFYFPPPVSGMPVSHRWSFLEPVVTLTTVADQAEYTLSEDFTGMSGNMIYEAGSHQPPIRVVSYAQLRETKARADLTQRPRWAAIRPVFSNGTTQQRHVLILYPTPDQEYILEYKEKRIVRQLSESNPIPLGGEMYDSVILESCLSVAELRENDTIGPHHQRFMELLIAAVDQDRHTQRRDIIGYNGEGGVPYPIIQPYGLVVYEPEE